MVELLKNAVKDVSNVFVIKCLTWSSTCVYNLNVKFLLQKGKATVNDCG